MAIFERTYGKVEQRAFQPQKKPARTSLDGEKYSIRTQKQGPEYLLVDGYNVIFAWEELERLARQDVAAARGAPGGYPLQLSGLPQVRGHPGL
mgnify:CR=1 FL=1